MRKRKSSSNNTASCHIQCTLLPLLYAVAAAAARNDCQQRKYHKSRPPPVFPDQRPRHGFKRNLEEQLGSGVGDPSIYAQLKRDLLMDYDSTVFPFESVWEGQDLGNREGLEVFVGINFHRVFNIDVASSVIDLIVWFREAWTDPRLSWNPDEYDNITKVWFWVQDGSGSGGETSEIWTPDIELWNMENGLADSLVDAHAFVTPDGYVFWSRPGHLQASCKFAGFEDFPFDQLDCVMEIGSWTQSGLYIRPSKYDGTGFSIGGSETAGESFAEYTLDGVQCTEYTYGPYVSAPEEDWPVLFYNVRFARAWRPYVRGYLVLQIILNLVAFCSFWLPPHIGERMGLAITALLAAVASELVISEKLPSTNELTWFTKFSLGSLIFASAALFESAVVIYFYYLKSDDLVPPWWTYLANKLKGQAAETKAEEEEGKEGETRGTNWEDSKESDAIGQPSNGMEAIGKHSTDGQQKEFGRKTSRVRFEQDDGENEPKSERSGILNNGRGCLTSEEPCPDGSVDDRDVLGGGTRWVSLTSLKSDPALRAQMAESTRVALTNVVGRDADDFKSEQEMENNLKWKKVAALIDEVSRLVFPVAFAVFTGLLFTSV